ncbi:sce7726 family protein [Chromobacterium violaceum]|uniref:sce7726 family protein n=1 Tax=Chromobacterium violaceum TaxID=536 RepID=UPI0009B8578D|nr:sce7726 family protein [Chromobacterium violaceum]
MISPDQIRLQLRQWVTNNHTHHESDVLIDELCFVEKRNRADLVHANGKLTAYEIKSAADSMQRWPSQHEAYLRVFDTVWLCCHNKHIFKALELSHPKIGLMVLDDQGGMAVMREARQNKLVDAYDLTGFLWREELDALCHEQNLPIQRKEKIREVRRRVADTLPLSIIRNKVLESLKLRYGSKYYSSSSPSGA